MLISIIASCDEFGVIGMDGKIPWHCPSDMSFFKWKTLRHPVIMGMETFRSLGSKPLSERINIVITRKKEEKPKLVDVWFVNDPSFAIPEALRISEMLDLRFDECFIIGGESIYQQFLDLNIVDKIYLNRIKRSIKEEMKFSDEGHVYRHFPKIPNCFKNIKATGCEDFVSYLYVKE